MRARLLALLLAAVTSARAQTPSVSASPVVVPSPPPAPPAERWYGAPALGLDGLLVGTAAVGFATAREGWESTPVLVAYGGYVLAGPALHIAHGQGKNALLSLGLRVSPFLLAYAMLGNAQGPEGNDGEPGAAAALVATLLAGPPIAMLLDDLLIARAPVATPASAVSRGEGTVWSPLAAPVRGGGWVLGAAGRF